jgi:hypothetical protein
VEERLSQLCSCDPDEVVLVVVEPGDTLGGLEEETGLSIASSPFDDARFPSAAFVPVWEWAEEHKSCWECAFVTTDSSSTTLFVPKQPNIDADLLALCARFCVPAFDPAAR